MVPFEDLVLFYEGAKDRYGAHVRGMDLTLLVRQPFGKDTLGFTCLKLMNFLFRIKFLV